MRWSSFSSASRSALLFALVLGSLSTPLMGQSTTNAPPPPDGKPSKVLVWPQDLLTLRSKIAALESSSQTLAEQVTTLQSQLQDSETIQQTLSDSLTQSSTALESLTKASEDRAKLDQKAIDEARGQNLIWCGGGVLGGALVVVILKAIFSH